MPSFVILVETALFASWICALHLLRRHVGLAPLYLSIGVIEVFFFVAGKGGLIFASFPGTEPAALSGVLFLPLLLGAMVLVYVLEGTREARRVLVALALIYLLHGVIDAVLFQHAAHPPPGFEPTHTSPVLAYDTWTRFASFIALSVDMVLLVIIYQSAINRFPRLPSFIPLFAGLVLVAGLDGIIFGLLSQGVLFEIRWLQNIFTAIFAALPISLYLDAQLRRNASDVLGGVVERDALELLTLREALQRERERSSRVQTLFRRYLSRDVVDALDANPDQVSLGGEKRVVTILFADIRGYSTLSEHLDPQELIGLLNQYFSHVGQVILDHDGMINEFEGDAILAVFGAPLDLNDHAGQAMRSASRMLEVVDNLNELWREDGTEALWRRVGLAGLRIRIGVHTGEVVVGNVGMESRMKYAVIGDAVNTAARIESLNKTLNTSALISRATVDAAEPTSTLPRLVERGTHVVRGRDEAVEVLTFASR